MASRHLVVVVEGLLGGLREHVVGLVRGLDPRDYAVTLVYSMGRADPTAASQLDELKRRGIRLVEVPMRRGLTPLSDLACLVTLTRLLRRIRPDIVHCHAAKAGMLGRVAARLSGIRHVVYTPHGGSFHQFGGLPGALYRLVERLLTTRSVHFIAVSEHSRDAIERALGLKHDRVHVVHNGIDLRAIDQERAARRVTRAEVGVPADRFLVLYAALFLEWKGHLDLLDAMARGRARLAPQVLILLAGEGPLEGRIRRRITGLGLDASFRFLGFERQLARFYEVADLVLLPSTAEGFPYVPLEAMAFAKPILATAVGGVPEVVRPGYTGELIAPDQLGDVVPRLNYYSEHRAEAVRLGRNGRAAVEQGFTLERMIANTSRVYQHLLGGVRPAS